MTSHRTISFQCPVCDSRIYADAADERVVCPDCLESVEVPPEKRAAASTDDDESIPELLEEAPVVDASSARRSDPGDTEWESVDGDLRLEPLEEPGAAAGASDSLDGDLPSVAPLDDDELRLEPLAPRPNIWSDDDSGSDESIPTDSGDQIRAARRNVTGRFGVTCTVCDTRVDVAESQIGTTISCPDCGSAILVEAPPPEKIQHREWEDLGGDDYAIAEPEEVDVYREMAEESEARAEREEAIEIERKRKVAGPLPDNPLREGVWQFFGKLTTWLIIGIVAFVQAPAIAVGYLAASISNPALATAVGIILGLPTSLMALFGTSVMGLTVLQESAEGWDEVEDLPPFNVLDWLGDGAYCVLASLYALVPGGPVISLVASFAPWWVVTIVACLSWFVVYPFVLTSMLENASLWYPISKPIWASMRRHRDRWQQFYWRSALIVVPMAIALAIPVPIWLTPLSALIAAVGWVAYHRLLGRLIWWISSED